MTAPGRGIEAETDGLLGLATICRGFLDAEEVCRTTRLIESGKIPSPLNGLLVHEDHMTTTLGRHYGQPVDLHVLKVDMADDWYSRLILLTLGDSGEVVEVGIARIRLDALGAEVRELVVSQGQPLGDILIEHDVLRTIHPQWYFRFDTGNPLLAHFNSGRLSDAFGRIGVIKVAGEPVIDVLEVVADVTAE